MTEGELTRRGLRHTLIRRRNARIMESDDDSWPLLLRMSSETLSTVLVDDDPAEQATVDFEGRVFMGIPVLTDDTLPLGEVAVGWPPVGVGEVSGG